jgi:osmotically-inducible protein OsmY
MGTNLELQEDVLEELRWNPMLDAAEIGVIAKDGVITLTGKVNTYLKKLEAEKASKKVSGVKAVVMDIEVSLGDGKQDDSEIAVAALNALKWHSSVPNDKVKLKIDNGWITLEGQVDWQYQKDSARNCVENLFGVRGVTNLIMINQNLKVKVVKDNITKAFHRNAALDAARIAIDTVGNKVILKGKVHSWFERNEAENAAWNAPGVSSVEDDLVVSLT